MSAPKSPRHAVEREAAHWLSLRDGHGFTPSEQEGFDAWLAADPNRAAAIAKLEAAWQSLDKLRQYPRAASAPADPDFFSRSPWTWRMAPAILAAAAALAIGVFLSQRGPPAPRPVGESAELFTSSNDTRQVRLSDGSVVEMNANSEIVEEFTPPERRVRLLRGEANFSVAKNRMRPFIVSAHGVDVRAVGTAFNVCLRPTTVEVLVTEGRVQVAQKRASEPPATSASAMQTEIPLLVAGQQAVIRVLGGDLAQPPAVGNLSPEAINRALAWQTNWLVFEATPLIDVAADFNRKNTMRLVVADPDLAKVRISGHFRADDVESFVQLLESSFGVRAERRPVGTIALRRAR